MKDEQRFAYVEELKIIRSGKEYFDYITRCIRKAEQRIHLQFYIIEEDRTGKAFFELLIGKAKSGTEIYLMADGYGSQHISRQLLNRLKEAGIRFRFFNPIFTFKHYYLGRRLHHKIILIDHSIAIIGGINISDKYNQPLNHKPWLDYAVYCKGSDFRFLENYLDDIWHDRKSHTAPFVDISETYDLTNSKVKIRIVNNDWIAHRNSISNAYIRMFRTSKKEIIILGSYFIPGRVIRRMIRKASKRGVTIKLILTGISDVGIAKNAERWLYDWLIRNGILIYEYQQTVLHGKIAISDEEWFTIGSYNINNISTYASIEMNVDIFDPAICATFKKTLNDIMEHDCIQVNRLYHLAKKTQLTQLKRWFSYQLYRFIFLVFTFYFKRET